MENTVPMLSIVFIIFDLIIGIGIPAALFFVLRKKFKCDKFPFLAGCLVMLIFAFLLEQGIHFLVLNSQAGASIKNNIWCYGLYGGFMAGLFEESGRYLAFRTVLKKNQGNDRNAWMYGAGHGGFEMFCILSLGMVNNLVYAIMINTGSINMITANLSGDQLTAIQNVITQLSDTSPAIFLVSALERFAALTAQISLSVLVWFAAKKGRKAVLLYPIAIILHMILDSSAVILNHYISHVLIVELAVYVLAAICAVIAVSVWKKCRTEKQY